MEHVHIAIVGAGMTGMTAAMTLARAGVQGVAVFEAAHALEEVGAGIAIGGNAVRVLKSLGVDPAQFGHVPPALEFRNWDDAKILSSTEVGGRYTHDIGAPYLTFHRATLQRALAEKIREAGVALHMGQRLVGLTAGDAHAPARLLFQGGNSLSADVVIAADGIRSVARTVVAPESKPRYSGEVAFRGVVPARLVPHYPSPENLSVWCGPKTHAVNYAIDDGALINLFAVFRPPQLPDWTTQTNRQPGDRGEALENFRARCWHDAILDVIRVSEGDLHYWSLMDLPPLPRWSAQRVVLAGDCAHGTLPHQGMGGGMGIESGYSISALLAAVGGNAYAEAFAAYEALRKPRTTKVQLWSRLAGQVYKLSAADSIDRRNQSLWRVGDNIRWIHAYDIIDAVRQVISSGSVGQQPQLPQGSVASLDAYLIERFDLTPTQLVDTAPLSDLGLDSLDVAELCLEPGVDDVPGKFNLDQRWTVGALRPQLRVQATSRAVQSREELAKHAS